MTINRNGIIRDYTLELSTSLKLKDRDEDDDDFDDDDERVFIHIGGTIVCRETPDDDAVSDEEAATLDEDGFRTLQVGRVSALLINLHRCRDPFSVMDNRDQEMCDLHSALFKPARNVLKPAVAKIYDPDGFQETFIDPLLYVGRIEVVVAHRDRSVGLLTMQALLDHYSAHATLAVCKPFPIHRQPGPNRGVEVAPAYFDAQRAALPDAVQARALQRHWSRAGFKKIPGGGGFYAVNLQTRGE
jgi:hypothetical protein